MVSIRTLDEPALVPCIFYRLHWICIHFLLQEAVNPGTVVSHVVCSEGTGAAIRASAPCTGGNFYLRHNLAEDGLCTNVASRL